MDLDDLGKCMAICLINFKYRALLFIYVRFLLYLTSYRRYEVFQWRTCTLSRNWSFAFSDMFLIAAMLGAVRIFVLHDNSDKISEHSYKALSEFYNWVVHKFTKNILSELLIIVRIFVRTSSWFLEICPNFLSFLKILRTLLCI